MCNMRNADKPKKDYVADNMTADLYVLGALVKEGVMFDENRIASCVRNPSS